MLGIVPLTPGDPAGLRRRTLSIWSAFNLGSARSPHHRQTGPDLELVSATGLDTGVVPGHGAAPKLTRLLSHSRGVPRASSGPVDAGIAVGASGWSPDVLVIHACISGGRTHVAETTVAYVRPVRHTNDLRTVRVLRAFPRLPEASSSPLVVNVSSGLGALTYLKVPDVPTPPSISWPAPRPRMRSRCSPCGGTMRIPAGGSTPWIWASRPTDFNVHRGTQTLQDGTDAIIRQATAGRYGPTVPTPTATARFPVRSAGLRRRQPLQGGLPVLLLAPLTGQFGPRWIRRPAEQDLV